MSISQCFIVLYALTIFNPLLTMEIKSMPKISSDFSETSDTEKRIRLEELLNKNDNNPSAALAYIAYKGKAAELVKPLIDKGADLYRPFPPPSTFSHLHIACARGHLATAEALISCGANVNARDDLGYVPLHYVFKNTRLRNPLTCDKYKTTTRDQITCAALLLYKGANPDIPFDSTNATTPLTFALYHYEFEVATLLIRFGATITKDDIKLALYNASDNLRDALKDRDLYL